MHQKNQLTTFIFTRTITTMMYRLIGSMWMMLLTPLWLGLALFYVVFERAIDLRTLWRVMPDWSVLDQGLFWCVGLCVWTLIVSRWMCPALFHKRLHIMWRSPITPEVWSVVWWPLVVLAFLPILLVVVSSPWPWMAWIVATWSAPWFVLSGHRTWRSLPFSLFGGVVVAAAMVLSTQHTVWMVVMCLLGIGWLFGVGYAYDLMLGRLWGRGRFQLKKRARESVVGGLFQFDLLCVFRTQRLIVGGMFLGIALLSLFAFAVARHGGDSAIVGWVLLCLLGPAWMQLVIQLYTMQGARFFSAHWPVRETQRVLSLGGVFMVLVCMVLLLGTIASIAGQQAWLWWQWITTISLGMAVGVVAIWAALAQQRHGRAGHYLLFGVLALFFVTLAPWWVHCPVLMMVSWYGWRRACGSMILFQEAYTCQTLCS